jgi:Ni/Co efflux regulator RcnB
MRKGLWIVAAVALLGSSVVMADDQGPRPDDRGRPGDQQRPGSNRPAQQQRPGSGRPGSGRPGADRPGGDRPDAAPNNPAPGPRPPAHRPPTARPPVARPPYGRRPPHRFLSGGGWHHSIRGPAFRYPPGFSYRAWTTGAILPSIFLNPSYYFDDYAPLGLGPPPAGYRWVRYGPDLLLVNVFTGRVADVVDGVFF